MVTQKSLSVAEARRAIATIAGEMARRGTPGVVAVADRAGDLIALERADGAPLPSILIATNKAFTAAREGKPTRDLGQAARDAASGFDMAYFGDRRYIGWGGGIPVVVDGQVVGAVAVSGLPESVDMELATMGIAAMLGG